MGQYGHLNKPDGLIPSSIDLTGCNDMIQSSMSWNITNISSVSLVNKLHLLKNSFRGGYWSTLQVKQFITFVSEMTCDAIPPQFASSFSNSIKSFNCSILTWCTSEYRSAPIILLESSTSYNEIFTTRIQNYHYLFTKIFINNHIIS